jgi:hypothetical protein
MTSDLSEFFALLNSRAIEYLVIGGVAYPRTLSLASRSPLFLIF